MECQCNNEPSTITAKPLQSSISRPLKEQSNSCPGSSRILVRPLRAGFIHQQHPTWRDDGNECHVDSESSTARGKDQSTDSCNECEHCSNAPCPQTETPDHEILPSPWFEQHTMAQSARRWGAQGLPWRERQWRKPWSTTESQEQWWMVSRGRCEV